MEYRTKTDLRAFGLAFGLFKLSLHKPRMATNKAMRVGVGGCFVKLFLGFFLILNLILS
jgi:hypothetical protein